MSGPFAFISFKICSVVAGNYAINAPTDIPQAVGTTVVFYDFPTCQSTFPLFSDKDIAVMHCIGLDWTGTVSNPALNFESSLKLRHILCVHVIHRFIQFDAHLV